MTVQVVDVPDDPRVSRGKTLLAECAIVAAAAGVATKHDDPGMADSLNAFAADLKDQATELLAAADRDAAERGKGKAS